MTMIGASACTFATLASACTFATLVKTVRLRLTAQKAGFARERLSAGPTCLSATFDEFAS